MSYCLPALAARLQELIAREPRKPLNAFCRILMISRHTARKALRQSLGMTFREIQRKAVIELLNRLLGEGPALTVKEMSFRIGFASEATFCHFLKRTVGVTPTEYRIHKMKLNPRDALHF